MPNGKCFVIDTSTILYSANSIKSFGSKEVVIPYVVLEELDKFKTRDDEVGKNARQVVRELNELRAQAPLSEGVVVNVKGGKLRVELNFSEPQSDKLALVSNDDRILNVCLGLQKVKQVVLVSKDINLLIRADVLGIGAQDYVSDKLISSVSDLYTGTGLVQVSSKVIDDFFAGEKIYYPDYTDQVFYPNQYLTLEATDSSGKSALARVQYETKPLVKLKSSRSVSGIQPRNREQQFVVDALLNRDISLVSITGMAGSGKTILSIASCLQLMDEQAYSKLIVSRPIQPMGKDIGYLPGTMQEKMDPWMCPIRDAINFLRGPTKGAKQNNIDVYSEMIAFGMLEVEPLTYIRGRSLPNTLFLIDEAEDLNRQEIKTIVSRMGENSKIILIGDVMQITNPYVDSTNNGLSVVAEKFKDFVFSAHITLSRGERSELATAAAELL